MAFCNSCGTTLEAGARFCPKCGAAIPEAAAIPATVPAPPVGPPQGSDTLKIILMVVAVVIGLGILGIGTLIFVVHRIAHNSHVQNKNGNVSVETPFGTVHSTHDPDQAARNLAVDPYPGSRVVNGNSATVGSMHTVNAEFETDDSADKVKTFYASKLPNATITTKDQDHFSIASTNQKNIISIKIESSGGKTRIKIASVSGKNLTGDSSSD
jgi:hypothetical protein